MDRKGQFSVVGLVCALVLGLSPFAAAKYGGGSGTADDPYLIYTPEQMNTIGADPNDWDKHFKLMVDIDLGQYSGTQFNIIGYYKTYKDHKYFRGVFDGNGHSISHFTYTSWTVTEEIGLFGYTINAQVRDLRLVDPNVAKGGSPAGRCVGTLAGYAYATAITGCSVEGGNVAGYDTVGGLVGRFYGTMSGCHSTARVSGHLKVGGLVGESSGTVEKCHATSQVQGASSVGGLIGSCGGTTSRCWSRGDVRGESAVGGLAGSNGGTLEACFSDGLVNGTSYCGGLAGSSGGNMLSCYAQGTVAGNNVVGGLLGHNQGQVYCCYSTSRVTGETSVGGLIGESWGGWERSSYWDIQTSGQIASTGGTGFSTAQMQTGSTFRGWHSNVNWTIAEGLDYPRLAWEDRAGQPIPDTTIQYRGGSGTPQDPYLISTPEEFVAIGCRREDWGKCFVLTSDLDMSEVDPNEVIPLGDSITAFTGVFDGAGHIIANFTCLQDQPNVGVFGILMSPASSQVGILGVVKDVHLANVQVRGTDCVAGLVALNRGTVTACTVEGDVAGASGVGGVVGSNYGEIDMCRFAGTVTATTYTVGGIAAENVHTSLPVSTPPWSGNRSARISRSCSSAQVTGQFTVGGVVGSNNSTITHCYTQGSVTGDLVGGIVGSNTGTLQFCYSTARVAGTGGVGGVAATNTYGTASFCLWDIEASGVDVSAAGKGKTTAEMKSAATYHCWGVDGLWTLDEGNDYPRLAWENKGGRPISEYDRRHGGGSGTADDPYQIRTAEQFITIGWYADDFDKDFSLMADLDFQGFSGGELKPIGTADCPFTGTFHGLGHTLSNMAISPHYDNGGVFGVVGVRDMRGTGSSSARDSTPVVERPGFVTDLHVVNIRVCGNESLGGLVGLHRKGQIVSCSAAGTILIAVYDLRGVGGLVGCNYDLVRGCWASGQLGGRYAVGGLVGSNSGTIESSHSTGGVTCREADSWIGGLVGANGGTISCCYSSCTVRGGIGVGGLAGYNNGRMLFSYSIGAVMGNDLVGGLLGKQDSTGGCISCFWDTETSGLATSAGGQGKTTVELQTLSTFELWGNDGVWTLDEGQDYPRLLWETPSGALMPVDNSRYGGGTGEPDDPFQIWTTQHFVTIANYPADLDKHFALMTDIDLAGVTDITPIGTAQWPFTGVFDGRGHRIVNVTCRRPGEDIVGVFGALGEITYNYPPDYPAPGEIKDVRVVALDVQGSSNVGGLVGRNTGTISGCSIQGQIAGTDLVGGFVGYNQGSIVEVDFEGHVAGNNQVGGLVGLNQGSIIAAHFEGSVDANDKTGGLVGSHASGTIKQSSASATVVSGGNAGGLVGGAATGVIEQCWAAGQVKGGSETGGLVGDNSSTITGCYADTQTEGGKYVGGLTGFNGGDVTECSAVGDVVGTYIVGGLVGYHYSGTVEDCVADTSVNGPQYAGGLVGWNWAEIVRCQATGTLLAPDRCRRVGGLVGINYWGACISGCHAGGSVTAGRDSVSVGGLAGENGGGVILDSYATAEVTVGDGSTCIGGLVGSNVGEYLTGGTVGRCYAAGAVLAADCEEVGGLAGRDQSRVFLSCWDVRTTGQVTSAAGAPRTTDEMMQAETFIGWGYDGTWVLDAGRDYPRLAWENMPGTVLTDPPRAYGGGSGTIQDPYRIETAEQLNTIGLYRQDYGKHFLLMADVAFDINVPFNVIGSEETPFTGSFEGNEHTVSNLYCPDAQGLGMFGCIRSDDSGQPAVARLTLADAVIKHAYSHAGCLVAVLDHSMVVDCAATASFVYGNRQTGGLVGRNDGGTVQGCRFEGGVLCNQVISATGGLVGYSSGVIADCQVSNVSVQGDWRAGGLVGEVNGVEVVNCHVSGTVAGDTYTGGLVGELTKGRIYRCHASGEVEGRSSTGGLAGHCASGTSVSQCYAVATVQAEGGSSYVGGLVGHMEGSLSDCYATGAVSVPLRGNAIGGLAGRVVPQAPSHCYATGLVTVSADSTYCGPLFGYSSAASSLNSCHFLDTGAWPANKYGVPLTDEQMRQRASFVGWDFLGSADGIEDIWSIDEGLTYPHLAWEADYQGQQ